jgi:hypothetical protein
VGAGKSSKTPRQVSPIQSFILSLNLIYRESGFITNTVLHYTNLGGGLQAALATVLYCILHCIGCEITLFPRKNEALDL